MAHVEPVALRFVQPELVGEVPSPPHDALTPEARRRHLLDHPRSYLGVTRAPEDAEPGQADVLGAGREFLERLLAAGVFGPESEPGFFVYRLEQSDHRQTGLVCGIATEDYDSGTVRIHEQINQVRASHLAEHLRVVGAQSSPIAVAYKDRPSVTAVLARTVEDAVPFLDFTDGAGLRQQVWSIAAGPDHEEVQAALAGAPLYLIDGHHRAAAASTHRRGLPEEARTGHLMLATIFPYEELSNLVFHRVLSDVDGETLAEHLAERLTTSETDDPAVVAARAVTEIALAVPTDGGNHWILIDIAFDSDDDASLANIDPVRLSNHILWPMLGIDESGSDPRLVYRPGTADAEAITELEIGDHELLFLMRPVPMTTLMAASDQGLVMPPKSTYFDPKVRSGLFVRLIDEPDRGELAAG